MAGKLRTETTVTLVWIANRLAMGSRGYLAHLLYWRHHGGRPPKVPSSLKLRERAGRRGRSKLPGAGKADRHMTMPWTGPVLPFDASFD